MQLSAADWEFVDERAASFTGRDRVFERLRHFLAGPEGAFVVTGPPGTGKSAVAARLVQASAERDDAEGAGGVTPLPPGTITAAAFCRSGGVDVLDVALQLSDQLVAAVPGFADQLAAVAPEISVKDVRVEAGHVEAGGRVAGVEVALDQLASDRRFARRVATPLRRLRAAGSDGRIVILVDALDESLSTAEGRMLPRLLAALEGVRLIVTTRDDPRVLSQFGHDAVVASLAGNGPGEPDDVFDFVLAKLTPEGAEGPMNALARRVATEAAGNFLYAVYVVAALTAAGSLPGLDDAAVATVELPRGGLRGVYHDFLRRELASDETAWKERFRPVLAPLMLALGDGLTTAQIAHVASRLTSRTFTVSEARDLLRVAMQFLAGAPPDGPFRPYHRSFAEFLTSPDDNPDWPIDPEATREALLDGLLDSVPAREDGGDKAWGAADPYVRTHLATHAAAVGRLDELLTEPGFLVAAEPKGLLRTLSSASDPATSAARATYRRAAFVLLGADRSERASYLEMVARQSGANALANSIAKCHEGRAWSVPWASWWAGVGHIVLGVHDDAVGEVVVIELDDGPPVIASAGADMTVRVWDSITGAERYAPIRGHEGPVRTLASAAVKGRRLLASGSYDGTIRIWDLDDGSPRGAPLVGHDGAVMSVAIATRDGRPVIVSAGDDGTVRLWNLTSGTPIREIATGHGDRFDPELQVGDPRPINQVAVAQLADGRVVIVSAGNDGTARRWWLHDGAGLGDPLDPYADAEYFRRSMFAVAVGEIDERHVIVTGDGRGILALWDLIDGRRIYSVETRFEHIAALATGELDRRPVILVGGEGTVEIRDLADGSMVTPPLRGHEGLVLSVALAELEGRPVVVSGGVDGRVRVWDLPVTMDSDAGLDRAEDKAAPAPIRSIAAGEVWGGRRVVITGSFDGTVRVWDPVDGTAIGEPFAAHHESAITAVTVGDLDGYPVIVTCAEDGHVFVHDFVAGGYLIDRGPVTGPSHFTAMDLADFDDTAVMTGDTQGRVIAWRLQDEKVIGALPESDTREFVSALRAGHVAGRALLVNGLTDGTLLRWDVDEGAPVGEPIQAHDDGVWSLAFGELSGRAVVASGGGDGTVRVWDFWDGTQIDSPARHTSWISSVALGARCGKTVVVSTSPDQEVRVSYIGGEASLTIRAGAGVAGAALVDEGVVVGTVAGLMLVSWRADALNADPPLEVVSDGEWAAAVGLVAGAVTAAGASPSVVTSLIEVFGASGGPAMRRAFDPVAAPEQQIRGQHRALQALAVDPTLRARVRDVLERGDPEAAAVADRLTASFPAAESEAVQAVTRGRWAVIDLLQPQTRWWDVHYPLGAEQRTFVRRRSPLGHQWCPVGGEDLGFLPDAHDRVRYTDHLGREVDPLSFEEGILSPGRPKGLLRRRKYATVLVRSGHVMAECENGHRWHVFAPKPGSPSRRS